MPRLYIVRQGDFLTRIAARFGFDPDALWDDPANAELRSRRSNREHLAPGDILRLPDTTPPGAPLDAFTNNRYRAKVPIVAVRVRLLARGEPIASAQCLVHGVSHEPIEATSTDDGTLVFEAPVFATEAEIEIVGRGKIRLLLGHIDPIEEANGVRQRLAHLGHHPAGFDSPNGLVAEAFDTLAVLAFQREEGLEPTGQVDARTRDALRRRYGV